MYLNWVPSSLSAISTFTGDNYTQSTWVLDGMREQLHAPTALTPGEQHQKPNEQEVGSRVSLFVLEKRQNTCHRPGIEPLFQDSLVTILTELTRLSPKV